MLFLKTFSHTVLNLTNIVFFLFVCFTFGYEATQACIPENLRQAKEKVVGMELAR